MSGGRGFLRPHSASSAESARTPHYNILADYNHPKARSRRTLPHTLEDDFTIALPSSSTGDSLLNLNDPSDAGGRPIRYVGLPVVTDDEGKRLLTEVFIKANYALLG